jgi:hypothetical protein
MKYFSVVFTILISLSLAGPSLGIAQKNAQPTDSLAEAGVMRPSDLVGEDIRWNAASPGLFTYWMDNGLYGFYGPQAEVYVDGIPLDANFFGWQNLNMLPLSSTKKNSEGRNQQVFNDNLSPGGFINFESAQLDSGFSASASFFAGNETGDPGPYVYDSLKTTPNIDRWGPDGELSLAYSTGRWYGKGVLSVRNHQQTDLASNARLHFTSSLLGTNQRYVNHRIYSTSRSALLETGYNAGKWGVRARTVQGLSKDYIFLQPFGREVPAKTGYRQLAIEGNYDAGSWMFKGRYMAHQKTIDKRIELHTYIFNWDQRNHTFSASARYRSDGFSITPGIIYERLKTMAPGLERNPFNDLITFSLKSSVPFTDIASLKVDFSADYDERNAAESLRLNFPVLLSDNWKVTPEVLYTEILPIRQHSFSYWVNRGYTFAEELDIPYDASDSVEKNTLTALKLRNDVTLGSGFSLVLEQQLINHQTLNVPFQAVEANAFITDTNPGNFSITQENGNRLEIYSELEHKISNMFRQSAALVLQRTISATNGYQNYFRQVPDTKFKYQIDLQPVPNLLLSLNATYRSSTEWNEFAAIEGNENRLPNGIPIRNVTGTFHTETPAYTDVSLSVQKWFFNRHLNTQFSLRNLLNEEVRMHPLGGELATKFDIKINVKL